MWIKDSITSDEKQVKWQKRWSYYGIFLNSCQNQSNNEEFAVYKESLWEHMGTAFPALMATFVCIYTVYSCIFACVCKDQVPKGEYMRERKLWKTGK